MRFEIWICLDLEKDLKEQEQTMLSLIMNEIEYMTHKVDDEGVMTIDVQINSLEDLIVLPSLLEDDIIIYGSESDLIMTKKTMRILGLD